LLIDQQWNATTVAGKEAARLDATALGPLVAADAATGTAIAAPATTTAPRAMANRVRDAKNLSSRDVSTVITIRRWPDRIHD
jgi:hypothetical protein